MVLKSQASWKTVKVTEMFARKNQFSGNIIKCTNKFPFELNLTDGHPPVVIRKNSDTYLENIPLSGDDTLDEDAEEEEEGLIHGGEVDADVEGQEEHELDEEAGVDEDVGDARADPHGDTGGGAAVQGVGEPKRGAKQQTWREMCVMSVIRLMGI